MLLRQTDTRGDPLALSSAQVVHINSRFTSIITIITCDIVLFKLLLRNVAEKEVNASLGARGRQSFDGCPVMCFHIGREEVCLRVLVVKEIYDLW